MNTRARALVLGGIVAAGTGAAYLITDDVAKIRFEVIVTYAGVDRPPVEAIPGVPTIVSVDDDGLGDISVMFAGTPSVDGQVDGLTDVIPGGSLSVPGVEGPQASLPGLLDTPVDVALSIGKLTTSELNDHLRVEGRVTLADGTMVTLGYDAGGAGAPQSFLVAAIFSSREAGTHLDVRSATVGPEENLSTVATYGDGDDWELDASLKFHPVPDYSQLDISASSDWRTVTSKSILPPNFSQAGNQRVEAAVSVGHDNERLDGSVVFFNHPPQVEVVYEDRGAQGVETQITGYSVATRGSVSPGVTLPEQRAPVGSAELHVERDTQSRMPLLRVGDIQASAELSEVPARFSVAMSPGDEESSIVVTGGLEHLGAELRGALPTDADQPSRGRQARPFVVEAELGPLPTSPVTVRYRHNDDETFVSYQSETGIPSVFSSACMNGAEVKDCEGLKIVSSAVGLPDAMSFRLSGGGFTLEASNQTPSLRLRAHDPTGIGSSSLKHAQIELRDLPRTLRVDFDSAKSRFGVRTRRGSLNGSVYLHSGSHLPDYPVSNVIHVALGGGSEDDEITPSPLVSTPDPSPEGLAWDCDRPVDKEESSNELRALWVKLKDLRSATLDLPSEDSALSASARFGSWDEDQQRYVEDSMVSRDLLVRVEDTRESASDTSTPYTRMALWIEHVPEYLRFEKNSFNGDPPIGSLEELRDLIEDLPKGARDDDLTPAELERFCASVVPRLGRLSFHASGESGPLRELFLDVDGELTQVRGGVIGKRAEIAWRKSPRSVCEDDLVWDDKATLLSMGIGLWGDWNLNRLLMYQSRSEFVHAGRLEIRGGKQELQFEKCLDYANLGLFDLPQGFVRWSTERGSPGEIRLDVTLGKSKEVTPEDARNIVDIQPGTQLMLCGDGADSDPGGFKGEVEIVTGDLADADETIETGDWSLAFRDWWGFIAHAWVSDESDGCDPSSYDLIRYKDVRPDLPTPVEQGRWGGMKKDVRF